MQPYTKVVAFPRSITNVDTFGQRLLQARELRGYSQPQLARLSGVSQSSISSYETGARRSSTQLVALARALQVESLWLATGNGPMESSHPGHALRDASDGWPFHSIRPGAYWALRPDERRAIEEAVRALMQAFGRAAS